MQNNKVTVRELANHFSLKQLSGDSTSLDREILVIEVNRPGLELAGFYDHTDLRRLAFIGNKEMAYIDTLSEEALATHFDFLMSKKTPAIVFSKGHRCPKVVLDLANEKQFPIFITDQNTSDLIVEIIRYLSKIFAPKLSIHASLVEIFGYGVLLRGDSGIGKSEIVLELVKRGHRLISDDRVNIIRLDQSLVGSAPEIIKGLVEVRGIGIIDITNMYGIKSLCESREIDCFIDLIDMTKEDNFERLGKRLETKELLGVARPCMRLPVSMGRNMADLIEVATTTLRLKQQGYNAAHEFTERYDRIISRGGKDE